MVPPATEFLLISIRRFSFDTETGELWAGYSF